jgi:hypothetical protein
VREIVLRVQFEKDWKEMREIRKENKLDKKNLIYTNSKL